MSKATLTDKRNSVKPVVGTYRWIRKPESLPLGIGRLNIAAETKKGIVSEDYDIGANFCFATHAEEGSYRVMGWRLVKDSDEGYDMESGFDGLPINCTCGDWVHRREPADVDPATNGCKHMRATRAALRAIGW